MRLLPFVLCVACATGIRLANVAGTWNTKWMTGPNDSVIVTSVISAHGKAWTMTFPEREPIPVRVVAIGGDSIVTEAGPYPSTRRPGQIVTLVRSVSHYRGNIMTGTFEASYSGGHVTQGKTAGTRE
jgi:hypothetical protein